MKLLTLLTCILMSASSATLISVEKLKVRDGIRHQIDALEVSNLAAFQVLQELPKVRSLFTEAINEGVILYSDIAFGFAKLFLQIIDKLIPGICNIGADSALSELATDFIRLNDAPDLDWTFPSRLLCKASQFLYEHAILPVNSQLITAKYDKIQKDLVKRIDVTDLPHLLEFFVENAGFDRFMIPSLFFEKESCGALTESLQLETIRIILSELSLAVKEAHRTGSKVLIDPRSVQLILFHYTFSQFNDEEVLFHTHQIIMFTSQQVLQKFDFDLMFTVAERALASKSDSSTVLMLELFLHPVFVRRIVDNYRFLSSKALSVWDATILYIYTLLQVDRFIKPLTSASKALVLKTSQKQSKKIVLMQKLLSAFKFENFEEEMQLIFEEYELKILVDLPYQLSKKIVDRIMDTIKVCKGSNSASRSSLIALSCLVCIEQLPSDKLIIRYFIFNLFKSFEHLEICNYNKKFAGILKEQLPKVARLVFELRLHYVHLGNCINIFSKYAPEFLPQFLTMMTEHASN